MGLWVYRDIAGPAAEVGAILGLNLHKTVRDGKNGWHVVAVSLRQADHTGLAATRASQFFVPLVNAGHGKRLGTSSRFVGSVPDNQNQIRST
jgi:hypothetical protein